VSGVNLNGSAADAAPSGGFGTFLWSHITGNSGGTMAGSGSWNKNGIGLNPGPNTIRVWAVDRAGRQSAPDTIIIFSDQVNPTIEITAPNGGNNFTTDVSSVNLNGSASDPGASSGFGTFIWSNITANSGGTMSGGLGWNKNGIGLNSGPNTIRVWAVDAVGRQSAPDSIIIFSDQANPTITIVAPNGGNNYTTDVSSVNLSGSATDAAPSSGFGTFIWSNITANSGGTMTGAGAW
ncbi:MAG: hypothetical protein GY869_01795, partial [Planctomycetes bacterium]|nr:hypothetical protein [Planctomycetota bacterium]